MWTKTLTKADEVRVNENKALVSLRMEGQLLGRAEHREATTMGRVLAGPCTQLQQPSIYGNTLNAKY